MRQAMDGVAMAERIGLFVHVKPLLLPGIVVSFLLVAALQAAGDEPSAAPTTAGQAPQVMRRWAIVPTDAQSAGLADLLTVELSPWKNVELVERQQIQQVLNELQLNASGLVAPDRTTQFGQLAHADALLLLEELATPGSKATRLRLVEARTSVKLLDLVLPAANVEQELQSILGELKRAGAKLTVPESQRRFLGVMAIKSEEPGEALKAFCRTLTALLEVRLQERPQLIVLEREQLQRLTAESNLTGSELKLRSAAWLLEAGVRRTAGNDGFVISCNLHSPASGGKRAFQVETPSREPGEVRNKLAAAVAAEVGAPGAVAEVVDLAAEAAIFAKRRDWFRGGYRYEETAEMAEAALALAPTPDNLRGALSAYYYWAHATQGQLKSHEALPAARRYQEMRLEWHRKTPPGSPMRASVFFSPFEPHVRIPLAPESEEDRILRAETDKLSKELFDLIYAEAAADRKQRLLLLLDRLKYAAYLAETGREFAETMPPLIEKFEAAFHESGTAGNFEDPSYQKFARLLIDAIRQSRSNINPSMRSMDEREWNPREVVPLWEKLARYDNQAVRVAGLSALMAQPGAGKDAAAELLGIVKDWPPIEYGGANSSDQLIRSALVQLPESTAEEFVGPLVSSAEQDRDATGLLCYDSTVFSFVMRAEETKKESWGKRILAALDRNSLTPEQVRSASALRSNIEKHLQVSGLLSAPSFSIAQGEGPWQDYVARPIAIATATENVDLTTLFVDQRPEAQQLGGELVLVWRGNSRTLSVERVGLAGDAARQFGPKFPGFPKPFHGVQVAVGPDAIFVASDEPGFVILRPDDFEVIDEEQGAPASEVLQLAWWKDRLFVAYRDALASFDPQTRSFQLIASSVTVEPRNLLDGRGSFFVNSLLPDETNQCLWLYVQDNALPRAREGVWRIEPENNTFVKITDKRAALSRTDGGFLLHLSDRQPWARLDPRTSELTRLTDYAPWTTPADAPVPMPQFVQIGEHIISANGQLYTPDGKQYRVKTGVLWNHLQRVGPGFITHYDEKARVLWYIEPKAVERRD